MSRLVWINALRFVLLMMLQILIMNRFNLYGYLNPDIYLMFILLLPFETAGWLLLLLAFFTGLTMDIFNGILGLHTAATVFAGFARPFVIKLVGERPDYDTTTQPTLHQMGVKWFATYAAILLFIHQFVLNFLDVFSFAEFWNTLFRIVLSTAITLAFVILFQYLFSSRKA